MQEDLGKCKAVQQLQQNLGHERTAVYTYMFTICDEVSGNYSMHGMPLSSQLLHAAAVPCCHTLLLSHGHLVHAAAGQLHKGTWADHEVFLAELNDSRMRT